jgi:uncharacterized membrane protein YfcA
VLFHPQDLSLWAYPLLFATGLGAGFVDTMAGGGGLISLPVLLNLGMPVPLALGTNKLQSSFGSVSASLHYARGGAVNLRSCLPGIVFTALGALGGVVCVQSFDASLLARVIPWLLAALVVFVICKPRLGLVERTALMRETPFYLLFGLLLGFYDGFFGPGVGSFWTIAFLLFMGKDFLCATGCTKVMNAASNVVSLILFALAGQIAIGIGLTMAAGQLLGAKLGSQLVLQRGARFIQPLFIAVVCASVVRLLWVTYVKG